MRRRLASLTFTIAACVPLLAARADEGLHTRAADDAAVGRSYLAPTALTPPAGSVTFTMRAPLYPALAGSLSASTGDRLEVSVGAGVGADIIGESDHSEALLSAGAKLQVLRFEGAALAVTASAHRRPSYTRTDPFDDAPTRVDRLVVGEIGAVGTACVSYKCDSIVSVHAHYLPQIWGGDADRLWGGASVVSGRGRSRVVLDATVVAEPDEDTIFLGYVGYRGVRRTWAFDVGALVAADPDGVIPWPTFGFSTRF